MLTRALTRFRALIQDRLQGGPADLEEGEDDTAGDPEWQELLAWAREPAALDTRRPPVPAAALTERLSDDDSEEWMALVARAKAAALTSTATLPQGSRPVLATGPTTATAPAPAAAASRALTAVPEPDDADDEEWLWLMARAKATAQAAAMAPRRPAAPSPPALSPPLPPSLPSPPTPPTPPLQTRPRATLGPVSALAARIEKIAAAAREQRLSRPANRALGRS